MLKPATAEEARAIHAEDLAQNLRMAELGAGMLGTGARVLTHCNTGALATGGHGTALGVIRTAWSAGRLGAVFGGAFPRSESGYSYVVNDAKGNFVANAALASRKDARDAVVAARKAFPGWSGKTAYNRAQILYRVAEIVERRLVEQIPGFKMEPWLEEVARRQDEIDPDLLEMLLSYSDFQTFRGQMLAF